MKYNFGNHGLGNHGLGNHGLGNHGFKKHTENEAFTSEEKINRHSKSGKYISCYTYNAFDEQRDRRILGFAAALLALWLAFSVTCFAASAGEVRNDVVRLHILANSDTEFDQQVKLAVRDALLKENTALVSGTMNRASAENDYFSSESVLKNTADKILLENGCKYKSELRLTEEYYTTRIYGDLTFPAGIYTSVQVVLGEGKGHNWWCVLFPPLCVPAADGSVDLNGSEVGDYLTENGEKIVKGGSKYKLKFKLLEWFEDLADTSR